MSDQSPDDSPDTGRADHASVPGVAAPEDGATAATPVVPPPPPPPPPPEVASAAAVLPADAIPPPPPPPPDAAAPRSGDPDEAETAGERSPWDDVAGSFAPPVAAAEIGVDESGGPAEIAAALMPAADPVPVEPAVLGDPGRRGEPQRLDAPEPPSPPATSPGAPDVPLQMPVQTPPWPGTTPGPPHALSTGSVPVVAPPAGAPVGPPPPPAGPPLPASGAPSAPVPPDAPVVAQPDPGSGPLLAAPSPGPGVSPVPSLHPDDPHAIGLALTRLGVLARRSAKTPTAVLGAMLGPHEMVEALIQGRFRGVAGVAALVGDAVVLANDRQWKPDVVRIAVGPELQVHGWQDERTAALTFVSASGQHVVDAIGDRLLAVELAQRVRDRAAGSSGGAPPPGSPPPPPPA